MRIESAKEINFTMSQRECMKVLLVVSKIPVIGWFTQTQSCLHCGGKHDMSFQATQLYYYQKIYIQFFQRNCAIIVHNAFMDPHWEHMCIICCFPVSLQFSCSVVSNSLRPHEPQHARPPCPSPTPRVHPNPSPLGFYRAPVWVSWVI